ncbi:MAG TPA: dihydroorotase [Gammaproteobacteria bacterium]|jgi:dihydroorotase|nr:dihydroorotase [Gammaproteobacteria bacterium]
MSDTLTLARPDDWHLHLRDGAVLKDILPYTARRFGRAIAMPNLKPPVTTTQQALEYRERILAALPAGAAFTPLMTLYLTEKTSPDEIRRAKASGHVYAVKYYPAGATTNADAGVTDILRCQAVLEATVEARLPLLVHGEVTDPEVDVFDRESVFIDKVLAPLIARLPKLKVVFEHITTKKAVDFVLSAPANVAATLTPQHLLHNRNAMFKGGIRPHYYCLPVLKREGDRKALVRAAVSGNPKFFLGTDSAPHARHLKEHACGCAGIFSAHAGIELYAEVFEQAGALPKLESFASFHGADFYGLPRNTDKLTLVKRSWTPPATYRFGDAELVPFRAAEEIPWSLA